MSSIDQATGQEASDKVNAYVNEPTQVGSTEFAVQSLVRRAYSLTRQGYMGIIEPSVVEAWCQAASVATGGAILHDDIHEAVKHDFVCGHTCTYHSGNSAWICHQPCVRTAGHDGRCACDAAPDSAHRGDLD